MGLYATDVQSILDLHLSFVVDQFANETENFLGTNIVWNAEQFFVMLHISLFFVFEIYVEKLCL